MTDYNDLIDKAKKGDQRSLGRIARLIDDNQDGADLIVSRLFPEGGNTHIVGVTGPPGAGKSTLVNALVREWRKTGRKIGVLAVDPTSPFSGGAVLGDRIRMQDHATDPGVFIRSLATRGHLGGLSRSVLSLITLLEATGFDAIILETVGVGQEEVEVKDIAHTTVFVTVPGLGDGIQAMKAGILEIADVYLVNKMDLPHAESAVKDLQSMLSMSTLRSEWVPPVLGTVASEAEGIPELAEAIAAHWSHLRDSDGLREWSVRSAEMSITEALREAVEEGILEVITLDNEEFARDVEEVSKRRDDPGSVAGKWLARLDFRED
ncbi:methylmalonyl Co-A mutase-associated GTPase MeaB [bacterium]|nr:MAG: methylmalonyl Co-A mutase-associated GTPase MeaB [bacterium]